MCLKKVEAFCGEAMMDKSYNGPGVILVGKQEFGLEEKPAGPVTVVFTGSERL